MARTAIVFPHVGYCTGWRPHLAREVKNGATYHIAQALTYLYSTAKLFSDAVRVFDFNFRSYDENFRALLDFQPTHVLVSSTVNSYEGATRIVTDLSRSHSAARRFVGGPAVSANHYLRPSLLDIDAGCEFVVTNRDIFGWTEAVYGETADVQFRTFQPDNSWIGETYPPDELARIRYTTVTSLGCTYTCNFCLNPKVYRINYKSPDVLEEELRDLADRYGAGSVSVADPFFFMQDRHAAEMMDVFERSPLTWSQQTCLVTLTDENLRRMAETGCTSVLVGVENFSTSEIDKPVEVEMLEDRLRFAGSLGIAIKPSFISGLLDIPHDVDLNQIRYIRGLIDRGLIHSHQVQSNIYTPYIPDARDRLLDVPFRFWGVLPTTARDEDDWKDKLALCDYIYEQVFPETVPRYREVRREYVAHMAGLDDVWMHHEPVPSVPAREMTLNLTSGKIRVRSATAG